MINEPDRTVTAKDFAIGVLGVTAVILLAALLAINAFMPGRALASAQSSAAGDYLVNVARLNEAASLLIVINTQQQLMNGYGFNLNTGQIDLIQQIDLERLTKDMQRFQREQRGALPGQEGTPPGPGSPTKARPRR
jgi:hypothetical protein